MGTGRYMLDGFCNAIEKRRNFGNQSYRVGTVIFEPTHEWEPLYGHTSCTCMRHGPAANNEVHGLVTITINLIEHMQLS